MDLKTFFEHFDTLTEAPNGIQRVRELILDMAVRGKLVPQKLEEKALHLNINPQYFENIFRKKIKKGKIYKPSKNEHPFPIPKNWEWTNLSSLGITQTGTTPPKSKLNLFGSDYPFVTPGSITESGITYSKEGLSNLGIEQGRFVPKESILMVSIGGSIGKVGMVDRDCSCNQQINYITLSEGLVPKLVFYWLKSPYFQAQVLTNAASTTIPILNKSKWDSFLVPLPPLAEQKRIVAKVDELMALCDTLEAAQQTRNTLRQKLRVSALDGLMNAPSDTELEIAWAFVRDNWGLMCDRPEDVEGVRKTALQIALRGKLTRFDPSDKPIKESLQEVVHERNDLIRRGLAKNRKKELTIYELPWEIPKHWMAIPVDSVAFSLDHLRVPVNKDERLERNGNVPYYGANGRVGWIDKSLFNEPLVLVVEDETFIGRTKPFSYLISGPSWVNNHAHVLRPSSVISPDFLNFSLMYYPFSPLTSGTTGRRKLTQPTLLGIKIPVPPLDEQKRIVQKVKEFWQLCAYLEDSLRQQQQQAEALASSVINHLAA